MRKTKQLMEGRVTYLIGFDTYFTQVLTSTETSLCSTKRQEVNYVSVAPRGRPLQLPPFLHKGLVLSPARFNFAPLVQPSSKSPSKSWLNIWKEATLSPPTTIAGLKQLIPCPMTDVEATVDRIQFTNSSRRRQASGRDIARRY